jgi:integrase
MLTVAERLELREGNPCKGVPRYKERLRERFLSQEEVSKLGQALTASKEDTAIRLLLLTGMRPSELYAARSEQITDRGLRLEDSKVGARVVPITTEARDLLLKVLPFKSGIRWSVAERWRGLRKQLSFDGVRLYDLRHSWASWALDCGASLPHIGKVLGHSSIKTTSRYAHVREETVRKLTDEVGAKLAGFLK